VKIAIVSDIHANLAALRAFPENYDELWMLGDLVNYGPQPAETVQLVRRLAAAAIRGNHDHAVAFREDPRCSPRFRKMAKETQKVSESLLGMEQKRYLKELPLQVELERGGARFYLCHATPTNPLHSYCQAESERWVQECAALAADFLLVGHTHLPFLRKIGKCTVVNPGSLGQPKTGKPEACYAVWNDGAIQLKSFKYPVGETIARIRDLGLSSLVENHLIHVLRSGGL
jgi:putative phosphoesterase